ncbi:hypothetical protein P167DRAFT_392555 [Morchella conica CCBAS932]|uniref:C2H2-type domain-containing protein n=1 Tax=Morchella conica CCBAS932 TaxID=1392247 RepID=A0A3N4KEG2_9PEZI|nr:hypothetical protein P167DRAFT_392555 [Morchella conica CCBAS932]
MANNNGNVFLSIDQFKSRMQKIVQQLELISTEFVGVVSQTDLADIQQATNKLKFTMLPEDSRHSQGVETYGLFLFDDAADTLGRRNQHTELIGYTVDKLVKTVAGETISEQQPNNDLCQQSATYLDWNALSSISKEDVDSRLPSHGDDQASVADSGSSGSGSANSYIGGFGGFDGAFEFPSKLPLHIGDDQASVADSGSSGSGSADSNKHVCGFEGCKKAFKFLSKLRDHARSHEAPAFPCPVCNQKFKQSRILKKHLFRIHKINKANQNQDGAVGPHGTITDVTFRDLDITSQFHAFNMQTRQNQTYQLQTTSFTHGQVENIIYIDPAVFSNSDLIDHDDIIESDLVRYQQHFSLSSPETMSESDLGEVFQDGTAGSSDYNMGY